jgi:hypothetical protein
MRSSCATCVWMYTLRAPAQPPTGRRKDISVILWTSEWPALCHTLPQDGPGSSLRRIEPPFKRSATVQTLWLCGLLSVGLPNSLSRQHSGRAATTSIRNVLPRSTGSRRRCRRHGLSLTNVEWALAPRPVAKQLSRCPSQAANRPPTRDGATLKPCRAESSANSAVPPRLAFSLP